MSVCSTPPARLVVVGLVVTLVVAFGPAARAEPGQNDLSQAQERLDVLEQDFTLAVDRYEEARAELASLQQEATQAQQRTNELQAKVAEGRENVARVVGAMYRSAGQGDLALLMSAEGIADVGRRVGYLGAVQHAHTQVVERARADQRALEADLTQLREATEAAKATEAELGRMRGEFEAMVSSQRREVARIQGVIARTQAERAARERAASQARAIGAQQDAARRALAGGKHPPAPAPPSLGRSRPRPGPVPIPPARSGAEAAVQAALSQVGKPYRWGAAGPNAYDCSGLMLWAWRKGGVSLPHSSRAQYAATRRVSRDHWQPGDLLFFGNPIHHVGMYIGDGKMVAAPHSGKNVRVSSVHRRGYVGAGRP